MSKMSKEKQKQLALAVISSVAILGSLGYFLIKGGYDKLVALDQKKITATEKLQQMNDTTRHAKEAEKAFNETLGSLSEKENAMATGDLYSWMFISIRRFQKGYRVEIPQISPVTTSEVNLLPKFPYQQATVSIGGTAHYHELGRFIADFENAFPYMRISNLTLDLNPTMTPGDYEKLAFKLEITSLVKPG